MLEIEPMTWEEAERWKTRYENEPIIERRAWITIILCAIALARQEKEQADRASRLAQAAEDLLSGLDQA